MVVRADKDDEVRAGDINRIMQESKTPAPVMVGTGDMASSVPPTHDAVADILILNAEMSGYGAMLFCPRVPIHPCLKCRLPRCLLLK
jgi:hypothetical protein